ncbi:glycine cleavage system protein GcvH [Phycicoccus sp.]|uniref:glycine cleavage system protein GcvH n=1 Tax=Phycicoccus sp. TaxID=1902410 RepID=UPI002BFF3284|nr:glycine cleavage system protein GcvH [Phycicoccus sp.]HMM94038.1 glycine cleavage system protein GcvH [Phycicoccus sp.]
MTNPPHLQYTDQHEWLHIEGDLALVGITAFAADALGDIVYVDLPEVGATVTAGEACGEIESTKSVSELYAPVDGEVTEVNTGVADDPALINTDPFGAGWILRIRISGTPRLLDAAGYNDLVSRG